MKITKRLLRRIIKEAIGTFQARRQMGPATENIVGTRWKNARTGNFLDVVDQNGDYSMQVQHEGESDRLIWIGIGQVGPGTARHHLINLGYKEVSQ